MNNIMNNFPNKWFIVVTEENFKILSHWRDKVKDSKCLKIHFKVGCLLLSENLYDDSYFYRKSKEDFMTDLLYSNYKEITTEQFIYNVFNDGTQLCIDRRTLANLRSMNDCWEWTENILIILDENHFEEYLIIDNCYIDLFNNRGSSSQRKLLDRYNIRLPMTKKGRYRIEHEKCEIKVGDKVIVTRKFEDEENGFPYVFLSYMHDFVNSICEVVVKNSVSYTLEFNDERFVFPYFVLEKYEEEYVPYTFEDNLVGMTLIYNKIRYLILRQDEEGVKMLLLIRSYEDLLCDCTHLDGTPFGKLKK